MAILAQIKKTSSGEELSYFYNDDLNSRRAIISSSGDLLEEIKYTAFGELTRGNRENASFTGKQLDATGLYYFNARYYDPDSGRFLTQDPNKQGSGWYTYCNNNPINLVDPDGKQNVIGTEINVTQRIINDLDIKRIVNNANKNLTQKAPFRIGASALQKAFSIISMLLTPTPLGNDELPENSPQKQAQREYQEERRKRMDRFDLIQERAEKCGLPTRREKFDDLDMLIINVPNTGDFHKINKQGKMQMMAKSSNLDPTQVVINVSIMPPDADMGRWDSWNLKHFKVLFEIWEPIQGDVNGSGGGGLFGGQLQAANNDAKKDFLNALSNYGLRTEFGPQAGSGDRPNCNFGMFVPLNRGL